MRKFLLAAVALGGLTAVGASAAPAVHFQPANPLITNVDYYHGHHHWHHRHWEHNHWRYWD